MHDNEKTQIRNLIEAWAKAVRDENIDKILANHADDIVMFDVSPPMQSKGIEAYKKTWELFFHWAEKPVAFNITELEITANDSIAFCHGIGHCGGVNKDGVKEKLEFRLTVGFMKKDGQWVITHEHHSLPSEE